MSDALSLPFFQRVLLAGLLASVACGVLGTWVVARRMTSIAGGLAHAAFGGVGLGYLAGFPPLAGAAGFGVLAGAVLGLASRRWRGGLDTLISMTWAVGMALGIVFVSLAPGYAPDLMGYLFGSLLFVSWRYVVLVAALDVLILVLAAAFFKELEGVSFDEEFCEVAGVRVSRVVVLLLATTSLAIVTLIRVVGVILVIALLTIPASIGRHWTRTLAGMMALAIAVSAVCTTAGLLLSWDLSARFSLSVPPGPLIVLTAAALFLASAGARVAGARRGRRSAQATP